MPTITAAPPSSAGLDDEVTTVVFPAGLPGFPDAHHFAAERWGGEDSPFVVITCTDGPEARFVLVQPRLFFPDYRPEVTDEAQALIGLEDPSDVAVWVILTLGARAEDATANLLGPVIVNTQGNLAVQAVQPGRRWHPRTPLRNGGSTAR